MLLNYNIVHIDQTLVNLLHSVNFEIGGLDFCVVITE